MLTQVLFNKAAYVELLLDVRGSWHTMSMASIICLL